MKEETRKILSEALEEVMPVLTEPVSYSDDLVLWSNNESHFDSMAVVAFVSAVEVKILDTLGKDITIVSEKAFSQRHSPFRTMETLGLFIEELLERAEE